MPLKEETVSPLTINSYCFEKKLGNNTVRDHDHLNGLIRSYPHNRCNLPAKNTFLPLYGDNTSKNDNHLCIAKVARKIR